MDFLSLVGDEYQDLGSFSWAAHHLEGTAKQLGPFFHTH
jgi:hypothetical protein